MNQLDQRHAGRERERARTFDILAAVYRKDLFASASGSAVQISPIVMGKTASVSSSVLILLIRST